MIVLVQPGLGAETISRLEQSCLDQTVKRTSASGGLEDNCPAGMVNDYEREARGPWRLSSNLRTRRFPAWLAVTTFPDPEHGFIELSRAHGKCCRETTLKERKLDERKQVHKPLIDLAFSHIRDLLLHCLVSGRLTSFVSFSLPS